MIFHWSLSDSKCPQVSRTLRSILAIRSNIVVWIVYTRQLTSKSSSPFNNPLVTVPNAPIAISIIVTCMFHSFFLFPSKVEVFIYSFRVFHISVSWWSFNWVWVTARVLMSPGLFSVFWPFSIMGCFRWSPVGGQLSSPPVPLTIL